MVYLPLFVCLLVLYCISCFVSSLNKTSFWRALRCVVNILPRPPTQIGINQSQEAPWDTRVHHSKLGTGQAGDSRRMAMFLLGISLLIACQKNKKWEWESPLKMGKASSLILSRVSLNSLEENTHPRNPPSGWLGMKSCYTAEMIWGSPATRHEDLTMDWRVPHIQGHWNLPVERQVRTGM